MHLLVAVEALLAVAHACAPRSQGGAAYPNKPTTPPNPFALPNGTGACPFLTDHVIEWSKIYRDKYIPLMVDMAMHNDDVINLACYLAWGSSAESRLLVDTMLDELHQTRHDDPDIMGLFRLVQQVLSLNDNFKQNRLNLFLHGENPTHRAGGVVQNDTQLPGFIDLLVGQTTNAAKRMILIRWLVAMHDVEEAPNFMQPLPEVLAPSLLVRAPRVQPCSLAAPLTLHAIAARCEHGERRAGAHPTVERLCG